jgi:hypothetical protein
MLIHLYVLNVFDNTFKVYWKNISHIICSDGREGNQLFLIEFIEFIVFSK